MDQSGSCGLIAIRKNPGLIGVVSGCLSIEKAGRSYLTFFNWPEKTSFPRDRKILRAFLLPDPARRNLGAESHRNQVEIVLPKVNLGRIATVVCIEVANDR